MKKILTLSLFLLIMLSLQVKAATIAYIFNTNLSYGMTASADVTALQQFLADQGIYSGPITGNYLSQTLQAVQQFQTLNNITPASGYFGPLTRAAANAILQAQSVASASPAVAPTSGNSVLVTANPSGTVAGASTTNMLALIQFQLNKISWNVRNLQQRYFNGRNSNTTKTPTPVTAITPVATTTPVIASTPTLTSTPAPTPAPTPTPTVVAPKPTPAPVPAPTITTTTSQVQKSSGLMWGVYTGNSASALSPFVSLVGKSPNIQAIFLSLGLDSFPTEYNQTVGQAGRTLLIFWEPNNGTDVVNQPDFNYSAILSGKYDASMQTFAAAAKAYGYPVILVPMDEMNSNWEPWGGTVNGNSPAQFAQVWAHIHDIFVNANATNVKFGWAPNSTSVPNTNANAISAYWPGAQYVDYVGVDGFNGNGDPWTPFSSIFTPSLMNQLAAYGKPVMIFSLGSTVNQSDPTAKAAWIKQGLGPNGLISSFPGLAGWVWFNQNGGTPATNWLINSDPNSLAAFQAALP